MCKLILKRNLSLLIPFSSPADALSLHQVRTVPEAGGVTQHGREAPNVQSCLHYVPGGARDGGHDSSWSLAWEVKTGYQK